jgi:hypothetical protein
MLPRRGHFFRAGSRKKLRHLAPSLSVRKEISSRGPEGAGCPHIGAWGERKRINPIKIKILWRRARRRRGNGCKETSASREERRGLFERKTRETDEPRPEEQKTGTQSPRQGRTTPIEKEEAAARREKGQENRDAG